MTGIDFDYSDALGAGDTPEEREREFEERWQRGGCRSSAPTRPRCSTGRPTSTAAEFVRGKIRAVVSDPKVAELLVAEEHHRLQAAVRRHRLLRDLQPAQRHAGRRQRVADRGDHPAGVRVDGKEYEVDRSCFATGFDAMTGALLTIDIRGRDGLRAREQVGGGPARPTSASRCRLPQPVHHHRPGQPVGAHQHAAVDRAARGLDRRHASRYMREHDLAAIEAERRRPRTHWVAHVNEVAGQHAALHLQLLVPGRQRPGKPRVFMPYIGGFPPYVAQCARARRTAMKASR